MLRAQKRRNNAHDRAAKDFCRNFVPVADRADNLLVRRSLDAGEVLAELVSGLKDALDRALAVLWMQDDGVEAFAEAMGKGNLAPEAKRKAVSRAKARLLAALQQVAAELGWL